MTYRTFEQDLPYLLGKFRNPSFDPATGLDNETIRRDIGLLARELAGEPRPVVKARAFEYVTRNVRIDVNPHDWFVGFGCWDRDDRPLTALIYGWSEEADRASPELTELRKLCERTGATAIWKDFDHSVPDWEAVYELGFPGLLDRVRRYRRRHAQRAPRRNPASSMQNVPLSGTRTNGSVAASVSSPKPNMTSCE